MTSYHDLTVREAEAALEEFLAERGPARDRLRRRLEAEGQDADALLAARPDALVPLWRWVTGRLETPDAPGATDLATVPRADWPTWARYTTVEERYLSAESLELVDGVVSQLVLVVSAAVPHATWDIGRHRNKRYQFRHHPVLVAGGHQLFLAGLVAVRAREIARGRQEPVADEIAAYARSVIEATGAAGPPSVSAPPRGAREEVEAPEVVDIRDEGRGFDLEVGLPDETAHARSALVDEVARELASQSGVEHVVREDRDVLLVRSPEWSAARLRAWLSGRL